jgi:hypothetical protein
LRNLKGLNGNGCLQPSKQLLPMMDKDWKSTFWCTSNGQRLEIDILAHKQWTKIGNQHFAYKQWTKIGDQRFGAQGVARGCCRRSPFILFFISFMSNCMCGFGVTF